VLCVRWYLPFKLSFPDLVEMMSERNLSMVHTTIMRRVHHYAPEFERRWNRFGRPDEATRSAWCREQGLYPAELDAWKQDAIAGLGEARAAGAAEAREDRRRVKELERQLHRKDKALAETAALLVLSKKLAAVFHDGEDA
jgi:transposase-like protein